MSLSPEDERLVIRWARAAGRFQGPSFRSVELVHMHPDDALSGAGASKIVGRFVPIGTRAIYASDSEETTFRELTARKDRLAGQAQFDIDRYPPLRIAWTSR